MEHQEQKVMPLNIKIEEESKPREVCRNPIEQLIVQAKKYNEIIESTKYSNSLRYSIITKFNVNDRALYKDDDKHVKGTIISVEPYGKKGWVEMQTDEGTLICENIARFSHLKTEHTLKDIKDIFEAKILNFEQNGFITLEQGEKLKMFNYSIKKLSKAYIFMSTFNFAVNNYSALMDAFERINNES